jgi:hypothetical protein
MEPLSLYGNNAKKMVYLKFGHLSNIQRIQKKNELRNMIEVFADYLIFKMKRYEVTIFGYDRESWPFYPSYSNIVQKFIFHVGIVDIDIISYDDIVSVSKMNDPPYILLL